MSATRLGDLRRFYAALSALDQKLGGARSLASCSGRMTWPQRSVYFFMEAGEGRRGVAVFEADKPLPDKYRFLLFQDKREVEVVWNGKTSEVSNIVLPFQVIEQVAGRSGSCY